MIEDFKISRRVGGYFASRRHRRLFGKPFGEFEEDAPVGRILDFPECNDEP